MNPGVRNIENGPVPHTGRGHRRTCGDPIDIVRLGRRRMTHDERHRVAPRIAGRQTDLCAVVRRPRVMFVCREAVTVLGMIVIGVRVDVQRRRLADSGRQGHSEQGCQDATHHPSVCMPLVLVK